MNSTPVIELPQSFIPISLSGDFLIPLVSLVIALIYVIFTGVLYYHWNAYASNARVTFITFVLYFGLTLPPLLTMATIALFL